MIRKRRVKIVATLGPASNDYDTIRKLHEAGADVFRLNMSHGTHEDIAARHAIIRQVEEDLESTIAILADLQGPKLRVGAFADGSVELEEGATFRLDLDADTLGDSARVGLPHPEIFAALEPGARLLVNDGKIRLRVDECGADFANCTVTVAGTISDRKGVNVPDVVLPLAALPEAAAAIRLTAAVTSSSRTRGGGGDDDDAPFVVAVAVVEDSKDDDDAYPASDDAPSSMPPRRAKDARTAAGGGVVVPGLIPLPLLLVPPLLMLVPAGGPIRS